VPGPFLVWKGPETSSLPALDLPGTAALWAWLASGSGESARIVKVRSFRRVVRFIDLAGSITRAARLRLNCFLVHPVIITETEADLA
jgi:hypothetical protein